MRLLAYTIGLGIPTLCSNKFARHTPCSFASQLAIQYKLGEPWCLLQRSPPSSRRAVERRPLGPHFGSRSMFPKFCVAEHYLQPPLVIMRRGGGFVIPSMLESLPVRPNEYLLRNKVVDRLVA